MVEVLKPVQQYANKLKTMMNQRSNSKRYKDHTMSEIKKYLDKVQDKEKNKDAINKILANADKVGERLNKYDEKEFIKVYDEFIKKANDKSGKELDKLFEEYEYKIDMLLQNQDATEESLNNLKNDSHKLAYGYFPYEEGCETDYNKYGFIMECSDMLENPMRIGKSNNITLNITNVSNTIQSSANIINECINTRDFNKLNTTVLTTLGNIDILIQSISKSDICEPEYFSNMIGGIILPIIASYVKALCINNDVICESLHDIYTDLQNDLSEFVSIKENKLISNPFVYNYKNILIHRLESFKHILGEFSDAAYASFKAKKEVLNLESYNMRIPYMKEMYDNKKSELNRCYSEGTITLYERESSLQDLKDSAYLVSILPKEVLESTTNKELLNGITRVLYEKCALGELGLEERERLISKAKHELMYEADNNAKIPASNPMTMDKEPDKNKTEAEQKKAEKNFDKAIDKIGD